MRHLRSKLLAAILLAAPLPALADGFPYGGALTASSGDVAAAVATATLAAPTLGQWAITGLEINGAYATAGSVVVCTVTGIVNGTMTIDVPVGLIAMTAGVPQAPITYSWPIALLANPTTAVVFSCPSFGSGATHSSINIHGVLLR